MKKKSGIQAELIRHLRMRMDGGFYACVFVHRLLVYVK